MQAIRDIIQTLDALQSFRAVGVIHNANIRRNDRNDFTGSALTKLGERTLVLNYPRSYDPAAPFEYHEYKRIKARPGIFSFRAPMLIALQAFVAHEYAHLLCAGKGVDPHGPVWQRTYSECRAALNITLSTVEPIHSIDTAAAEIQDTISAIFATFGEPNKS